MDNQELNFNPIVECPGCGAHLNLESNINLFSCPECFIKFKYNEDPESNVPSVITDICDFKIEDFKVIDAEKAAKIFVFSSSRLALGEYEEALEGFIRAAILDPFTGKYWLYILYTITSRFQNLYLLTYKPAKRSGKYKLSCYDILKKFHHTAKLEDYLQASRFLNMDLSIEDDALWIEILSSIADTQITGIHYEEYALSADNAYLQIKDKDNEKVKELKLLLSNKLNFVNKHIFEINSLIFLKESYDELLHVPNDIIGIEFLSDSMNGSNKFKGVLVEPNLKVIGSNYPFDDLYFSENVKIIPTKLMYCAKELKNIHFPKNLKVIEKEAFAGCISIKQIDLPNGLIAILDRAFFETNIKFANIPSSVNALGKDIFGLINKHSSTNPIEKYLFIINNKIDKINQDWNRVGENKAGFILNIPKNKKIIYPMEYDGIILDEIPNDKKPIFNALIALYADQIKEPEQKNNSLFSKLFKKQSDKK